MKKIRDYLAGFVSCALLVTAIGTGVAAYTKTETLHFNGLKLKVDGEYVDVTDSTGAQIEPFIINGTTYLPVSNVAKMVGYDVQWDGPNQTVIMTKKGTKPDNNSDSMTVSQRNALEAAKGYLRFSAFSRSGLIRQLEYEQYSNADAVFAVDHCGADWYEQAVRKGQEYIDFMPFSRDGLIGQLEYEEFTPEQARYAVDTLGY